MRTSGWLLWTVYTYDVTDKLVTAEKKGKCYVLISANVSVSGQLLYNTGMPVKVEQGDSGLFWVLSAKHSLLMC